MCRFPLFKFTEEVANKPEAPNQADDIDIRLKANIA